MFKAVTFRKAVCAWFAIWLIALSALGIAPLSATPSSTVVISEFRTRGTVGGNDEFVELYNLSPSPVDISGWKIKGANANTPPAISTRATVPVGVVLNPGCHYLVTNATAGTGYSGTVPGNLTYTVGITDEGGVAITLPNDTVVDQVGMSAGAGFKEGTFLSPQLTTNGNRSYERKPGDGQGSGSDSDNNAADFRLISPSDPQNLSSPCIVLNGPTAIGSADPASVEIGASTTLQVAVTPGNPPTPIASVTADLTSIGGSSAQAFTPTGPLTYTFTATVGGNAGTKTLPVTIVEQAPTLRTGAAMIALTVAPPFHAVHDIQGSGTTSPFVGQAVRTEGIVTAQKAGGGGGFFIQTPDASADADPNTSEGIFVFTGSVVPPATAVGNYVSVTGTIQEFRPSSDPNSPPSTEFAAGATVSVLATGVPLPAAITLTAADASLSGSIEQLERVEGMRVHIDSLTVVAPTGGNVSEANATSTSNGTFFGVITGLARPFREPGIEAPDALPAPTVPRFDGNPERLRVDSDGQIGATAIDVTTGATVTNLTGVLDYSPRAYTILLDPGTPPAMAGNIAAIPVPAPAANQFTVASANLERFFDTTDDPGTSDVKLTPAAFEYRLAKASLMIHDVLRCPDIIGVEEMENLTTLQALAARVNGDSAGGCSDAPQYVAYLEEGNDIGGIDVGLLVNASRVAVLDVTQVGKDTMYVPPSGTAALLNDRPPLVLHAIVQSPADPAFAPAPVTVIVNHLRSLSGVDDPVDGARVRAKRQAQAEFLADLIQSHQAANPDEHIISIGDYNAFQFNDGYVDVMGTIEGHPAPFDQVVLASADRVDPDLVDLVDLASPDQRYSFMFDGNAQELDHVLVTGNMLAMTDGLFWGRNNTDFPEIYRNDPTRSERISDHDPVVAYFEKPQTTTTAVAVAPNPAVVNQPVTLTATVSAAAGPVDVVDAGSVTFKDDGDVLAAGVPVHSGQATTTLSLAAGDHTITAIYGGALLFGASTSADAPLKVETLVLSLSPDIVAEATGPAGAPVSFPAFASNDVETVPATCLPGSGSTFAIATTTVTCSATDPYGNTVGGQFNVTVRDTTPPTLTVSADPAMLWPPNHRMIPIAVTPRASDLVDPAPACSITSIASSEPDNGPGDGNTAGDFAITGALAAALRAERAGGGPGRAYTIAVRCRDAAGNAATATVGVVVPHSAK